MPQPLENSFEPWFAALERRQLSQLTFSEIRRALTALSSLYVERRGRLATGAALEGKGKRAAFALFYGPIHFLTTQGIIRGLGLASTPPRRILDLGCGTGVAGAAWAVECGRRPELLGVDRSGWAVEEARWTYSTLKLQGRVKRGPLESLDHPGIHDAVLAAFTVNELDPKDRERLLGGLLEAAQKGSSILVVEPIARRGFPWWKEWSEAFQTSRGRMDEWRFPANLPGTLRLLSKASGMDHRELKAKSLWIPASLPESGKLK
ncbi:MAG: class I SAM-dependent methyltransferase [Acidobacteria bacterium]|nr:class I SAM-dependent methyltransferase [Acidobacteriota bacterium]MCI0568168.1 class I SAM-dependent methyltransferase [Acidobacteriota bacterium]